MEGLDYKEVKLTVTSIEGIRESYGALVLSYLFWSNETLYYVHWLTSSEEGDLYLIKETTEYKISELDHNEVSLREFILDESITSRAYIGINIDTSKTGKVYQTTISDITTRYANSLPKEEAI